MIALLLGMIHLEDGEASVGFTNSLVISVPIWIIIALIVWKFC